MLLITGTAFCTGPCSAGPEVMIYLTVPLGPSGAGGHAHGGLRMDRHPSPAVLGNFASPFTRRAVLDLQMNSEAALRLQVDRTFSYDFQRGQWSGPAADMQLRLPAPQAHGPDEAAMTLSPVRAPERWLPAELRPPQAAAGARGPAAASVRPPPVFPAAPARDRVDNRARPRPPG